MNLVCFGCSNFGMSASVPPKVRRAQEAVLWLGLVVVRLVVLLSPRQTGQKNVVP